MQNIRWGHIGAGFVFGIVVNLGVAIVLGAVLRMFGIDEIPAVTAVYHGVLAFIGPTAAGYHIARKTYPYGIRNLIALWVVLAALELVASVILTVSGRPATVSQFGNISLLIVPAQLLGFWIDQKRNHQIAPPPLPR